MDKKIELKTLEIRKVRLMDKLALRIEIIAAIVASAMVIVMLIWRYF